MDTKSFTSPQKSEVDKKEQELKSNGFTKSSPLGKLQRRQYSLSQAPADHKSFEGPLNYTVEWSVDDE